MAKFLSQQLVASKNYAPKETAVKDPTVKGPPDAGKTVAGAQSTTPTPTEDRGPQAFDELLRREQEQVKKTVTIQEWQELTRRREELIAELQKVIEALEDSARHTKERLEILHKCGRELEELDFSCPAADVSTADLRAVKHKIHGAYIELLKTFRQGQTGFRQGQGAVGLFGADAPGFWQLTRLGLSFCWPVILALLAAAAVIVYGLFIVFRQGL